MSARAELALGLALLAALGAVAPAQESEGVAPLEPAPLQRAPSSCAPSAPADDAALDARLAELARAHPDWIALESLELAGGRPLLLAVLAERSAPSVRPAIFLAPRLDGATLADAGFVAALVCRLAERAASDPAERELLASSAVCALARPEPGSDPASPAGVRLERNFPVGWDPWHVAGAGPYPLARPEARALAQFLAAHREVAALVLLAPVAPGAGASSTLYAAEAGELEARGSLAAFAKAELGALAFECRALSEAASAQLQSAAVDAAAEAVLEVARRLPRLALSEARAQRIAPDLWQVDFALSNPGAMPTGPADGALPLRLLAEGARVLGAASQRAGEASYAVWAGEPGEVALAGLAAGESVAVRLLVEGPGAGAETALVLSASSARAGQCSATLALR